MSGGTYPGRLLAGLCQRGGAKIEACPRETAGTVPAGQKAGMATTLWGPERDLKPICSRPQSDSSVDQSAHTPATWRTVTATVLGSSLGGGGISSAARVSEPAEKDLRKLGQS